MDVLQTTTEKESGKGESKYRIRRAYLEAMKRFMADTLQPSPIQPTDDSPGDSIEKYLIYEREISCHLQELLGHSKI